MIKFSVLVVTQKLLMVILSLVLLLATAEPTASSAQETPRTVRVGWYRSEYCLTDRFGRRSGLAYEYQRNLAAYTGWTYEYVDGTWGDLLQMLKNGEIDLLSDVSYLEDRAEFIDYSSLPMGQESYYIYIKADNTDISPDQLDTFNGKRFGVVGGSFQEGLLRDWAGKNGLAIEIVDISKVPGDEYVQVLMQGDADALVAMDVYKNRENCVPVCKIGASNYYFAVSKKQPELLQELNYALERLQEEHPNYNQKMYEKYIASIKTTALASSAEKGWLDTHKTVRIGYRDGYLPFCDTEPGSGKISGILKDYEEHASTCLTNAPLVFQPSAYPTMEDLIDALKKGEVDCIFPANINPYDAESMGILTTMPMIGAEIYLVVRAQDQNEFSMNREVRVALPKGSIHLETFIKDFYPQCRIAIYDSEEDCHKAVADQEADCLLVSSYRINQENKLRSKYQLSLLATGKQIEMAFAVREEDRDLFSILNKTINLIPVTSTEYSISKYSSPQRKVSLSEYLRDNMVAATTMSFLVIALISLLLIQKTRAQKQAKERQELITATEQDPLTMLYNRNFFYEYANRMHQENPQLPYDAIVMNIEQFHLVNALHGMEFGDLILKALADEIRAYLDESDGIACRTVADQFGLYCRHTDDYRNILDRFQKKLDAISTSTKIRLRMGVMPWQEGVHPIQLFDRAGTACGKMRGEHQNALMVYNEDMRSRELRDQKLLNDLRRALEEHEFVVHYQPKYDIQADPPRLCSAEALVRWQHPELGMIPPFEFITLFENKCQINLLDQYVWREAARQMAEWRDKFGFVLPVSVNLSRLDVFDPNLESILDGIIQENGLKNEDLHLEVTESAYTEEANQVISIISKLREKGYRIEMDDFGTGYSSLNMLSAMPIDVLKLDRSFVIKILKDEKVVRLVEFIFDLAKMLQVPIVAEGVETEKEVEFLKARGCDMVQGYYFSKPLPASEFEKKLQEPK